MSTLNTDDAWGRAQYDWSDRAPSIAVIEAIVAVENMEPDDVVFGQGLPLTEYINPDALDSLVTHNDITISFAVDEYQIRIEGNDVEVRRD